MSFNIMCMKKVKGVARMSRGQQIVQAMQMRRYTTL